MQEFERTRPQLPPTHDKILMACDGACNVRARQGAWAYTDGEKLYSGSLVDCTNNQAEYYGLIRLLEHLIKHPSAKSVLIYMDSELVVNQIKGFYAVKNEGLRPLYNKAKSLLSAVDADVMWVSRETPIMKQVDRAAKAAVQL